MDFKDTTVWTFNERQAFINKFGGDELTHDLHVALTRQADRLLTLMATKMLDYGNDRFRDRDLEFDAWVSFTDVYRKFTRCEQLTRSIARDGEDNEELMDMALEMYSDLANYAMISLYHMTKHHPDESQFKQYHRAGESDD